MLPNVIYLSFFTALPSISSFGPPSMAVNVTEDERAELVCMGAGPPTPTFLVKKTTPIPGCLSFYIMFDWFSLEQR